MSFRVNSFQFDYVTATTKDRKEFRKLMEIVLSDYPKVGRYKSSRSYGKSYIGIQWENGIFMGERMSGNGFSHIAIFAGEIASQDAARSVVRCPRWHKTRIDCQVTVKGDMRPVTMARMLRDRHVSRGKKPCISSHDKGTRTGTVYVGVKDSERYATIYTKQEKEGGKITTYVRYEVELKGRGLNDCILNCKKEGMNKACQIELASHVGIFDIRGNDKELDVIRRIQEMAGKKRDRSKEKIVKTEHKTVKWLYDQVQGAIGRLSNSHDNEMKHKVIRLLESMVETMKESL